MADAQASGACSRKAVWVQVPSPAYGIEKEADSIKASFLIFRGVFSSVCECLTP